MSNKFCYIQQLEVATLTHSFHSFLSYHRSLKMAAKYIIGSVVASFAVAYVIDKLVADEKIFGGTTPHTVSNKEWWEETDKKFQAWPRTAGPPVVMNPISRQNFIVKSGSE